MRCTNALLTAYTSSTLAHVLLPVGHSASHHQILVTRHREVGEKIVTTMVYSVQ